MSTIKDPSDMMRTETKILGLFLALALVIATPLVGGEMPAAQAQTSAENITQAQEPAADNKCYSDCNSAH